MLCNSVSFHTLGPVLSFLRSESTSPMFGVALWSIVTSFSGGDTFLAAVRSLSPTQDYVLLSACDVDSECRRAIHFVHVDQPVAPLIHTSADSAEAALLSGASSFTGVSPAFSFLFSTATLPLTGCRAPLTYLMLLFLTSLSDVPPSSFLRMWHLCCALIFDLSSTISYIRSIRLAATESILVFCARPNTLLT